jgi:hypothetical protein
MARRLQLSLLPCYCLLFLSSWFVVCRSSGTAIIYCMRCNIMLTCYPAFCVDPRPSTRDEDNNSKILRHFCTKRLLYLFYNRYLHACRDLYELKQTIWSYGAVTWRVDYIPYLFSSLGGKWSHKIEAKPARFNGHSP